jgi:hypothetical protein
MKHPHSEVGVLQPMLVVKVSYDTLSWNLTLHYELDLATLQALWNMDVVEGPQRQKKEL